MRRQTRQDRNNNDRQPDDGWQQAWDNPEQMDAARKQALLNTLHQRMDVYGRRRKQLFFVGLGAAAAILVAVFIRIPGSSLRATMSSWQELASNGVPKKVSLADGSVLWLAPHSVIRIHPGFLQQRNVLLAKGTVFFSVAKDEQHPFSIAVNSQQVTVLGTSFSLHKLDSVDMQLTVKEGKVALDNGSGRRLLTAGQHVMTAGAATRTIDTIDPAAADWWLQRGMRWHNITLEELLNRVETYYQVKLSYGAINRKMKITLTWDLAIPLKDNLDVVNSLTGYNIH